jgi:multidrug transporter EmrE-like cation transporter
MGAYNRAWRWASLGAAALGLASAFLALAATEPTFGLALLTLLATAVYVGAALSARGYKAPVELRATVGVALVLVAVIGLFMLLGPVALTLLATLAVTGVPLLARQTVVMAADPGSDQQEAQESSPTGDRCWAAAEPPTVGASDHDYDLDYSIAGHEFPSLIDGDREATTRPVNGRGDQPLAASLNTVELCRAWSRSYRALRMATTPDQVTGISQARRVYLEALEERDPAGVARWLAAGPRADGDPTPYLSPSGISP